MQDSCPPDIQRELCVRLGPRFTTPTMPPGKEGIEHPIHNSLCAASHLPARSQRLRGLGGTKATFQLYERAGGRRAGGTPKNELAERGTQTPRRDRTRALVWAPKQEFRGPPWRRRLWADTPTWGLHTQAAPKSPGGGGSVQWDAHPGCVLGVAPSGS